MQQMQLWIFWAIAGGIHNLRLRPHAETKKEATSGNLAASGAEQHVPVLTTSPQKTTPSGSDKRASILDSTRPANRAASKFSCDLFLKDRFFHVDNFN
jgi:hypothetical protein